MTEPTDPDDGARIEEQQLADAADRDPLSTDDGLTEVAAAGMPEVDQRGEEPGEDAQDVDERPLLVSPDLDVTDDGTDPCAGDRAD